MKASSEFFLIYESLVIVLLLLLQLHEFLQGFMSSFNIYRQCRFRALKVRKAWTSDVPFEGS